MIARTGSPARLLVSHSVRSRCPLAAAESWISAQKSSGLTSASYRVRCRTSAHGPHPLAPAHAVLTDLTRQRPRSGMTGRRDAGWQVSSRDSETRGAAILALWLTTLHGTGPSTTR